MACPNSKKRDSNLPWKVMLTAILQVVKLSLRLVEKRKNRIRKYGTGYISQNNNSITVLYNRTFIKTRSQDHDWTILWEKSHTVCYQNKSKT